MEKNYKKCKNKDTDCCIIFSACQDCYYYESVIVCPFCNREMPNKEHLNNDGLTCKWCKRE